MARSSQVCLSLSSRPENVLVVRQALTGVASCLALDPIETNDLNTAVSEACNNVVMHAYEQGEEGPLEVAVATLAGGLEVTVRDRGRGLEGTDRLELHPGIGLPVIEALTREVELSDRDGGGTEVRMEFDTPDAKTLEEPDRAVETSSPGVPSVVAGPNVELELAPHEIARAVLPRVLSTLAARAHFSTDRISDIQLIADVLAVNAGDSIDGGLLGVAIAISPRILALRVGPLHLGRGESLMAAAADGLAPVVERLTDARRVIPSSSGETLELELVDRR